jgi:hypothetical protein
MSRIEDEIVRQLHLCAALMSDPLIMLEQSGMVADHFDSAMKKIETLQEFLHPPRDPCERNNWLDSSILTKGVKRMVGLVLAKHMEPLRWMTPKQLREAELRGDGTVKTQRNSAPLIFERMFDKEARKRPGEETLISRDIKETNCMASLVLLNYYLHWHVLLILLNYRIHPCIGGNESGADQRLNVDKLLKGLPRFSDTFELRPIRSFFAANKDGVDGSEFFYDSSDDDDSSGGESLKEKNVDPSKKEDGVGASSESSSDPPKNKKVEFDASIARVKERVRKWIDDEMFSGYMSSIPDDDEASGNDDMKKTQNTRQREGCVMGIFRAVMGMTSHPKMESLNDVSCMMAVSIGAVDKEAEGARDELLEGGNYRDACLAVLSSRITQARCFSTILDTFLCHGVYSVYNLQDDTQRWFDMYTPSEIKTTLGPYDETAEEYGIQSTQSKYKPLLAEVLNSWPYGADSNGAFKAGQPLLGTRWLCILDFTSASLMMDISRSFLKLYEIIFELKKGQKNHDIIKKKLFVFISQTFAVDKQIGKFLKTALDVITPINHQTHAVKDGWVSVPTGNHRLPANYSDLLLREFTLDEIAGLYWGSRVSSLTNVNHRYFSWPCAERRGYKLVLNLVQFMLNNDKILMPAVERFYMFMEAGLRNSMFVQPILESLLVLIDKLHCVPFFDGSSVRIESKDIICKFSYPGKKGGGDEKNNNAGPAKQEDGPSSEFLSGTDAASEVRSASSSTRQDDDAIRQEATDLFNNSVGRGKDFITNKQKLTAAIKSELASLSARTDRASKGEFKLYEGLSWPVASAIRNNYRQFGKSEKVPRVSAGRLVNAVELIAMDVHKRAPPT